MKRRSLLGAMLAAGAAPAFVKSGSLMSLYVPPAPKVWTPDFSLAGAQDFTIEGWIGPKALSDLRVSGINRFSGTFLVVPWMVGDDWTHIAVTKAGMYLNGEWRPDGPNQQQRMAIDCLRETAGAHGVRFERGPA